VSDQLDRWLDQARRGGHEAGEVDAYDVFVQIDCLAVERLERGDPRWTPAGGTGDRAMAKLVRSRQERGLPLRPPRR
jgi:hypothetical protein